MLVKRQRRCKRHRRCPQRHRRIFRRSSALAKKIQDLEEKEKKKKDDVEARKQQLKEEREKREAERNELRDKNRQTKAIQQQCAKALAKVCPTRAKLEKVLAGDLSALPSNIVKDAERIFKEVKALQACAEKHVSGEPLMSKDSVLMENVDDLVKRGEHAFKVVLDYQ